jgi:hypothetical protein
MLVASGGIGDSTRRKGRLNPSRGVTQPGTRGDSRQLEGRLGGQSPPRVFLPLLTWIVTGEPVPRVAPATGSVSATIPLVNVERT